MGKLLVVITSIFILMTSAWGRSEGTDERDVRLCSDLKPLVCSDTRLDDSTGSIKRQEHIISQFEAKKKAVFEDLELKIKKMLGDPNEGYMRRQLHKALGPLQECAHPDSLKEGDCHTLYTETLTSISARLIMDDNSMFSSPHVFKNYEAASFIFQNHGFLQILKQSQKQLLTASQDPEYEKKIESEIFPNAKAHLVKALDGLQINDEDRQILIDKIKGIKFGGFDCDNEKTRPTELQTAFLHNAYYLSTNQFNICRGISYKVQSEAAITAVIAHELSHALDPCVLASDPLFQGKLNKKSRHLKKLDQMTLYPDVLNCLRSSDSIAAQRKIIHKKKKPRVHCAINEGEHDQAQEAISDWLAAETMAEYFKNKKPPMHANDVRVSLANLGKTLLAAGSDQLCQADSDALAQFFKHSTHPNPFDRLNKIFLAQPEIRKAMGCNPKAEHVRYCEFKPDAVAKPIGPSTEEKAKK